LPLLPCLGFGRPRFGPSGVGERQGGQTNDLVRFPSFFFFCPPIVLLFVKSDILSQKFLCERAFYISSYPLPKPPPQVLFPPPPTFFRTSKEEPQKFYPFTDSPILSPNSLGHPLPQNFFRFLFIKGGSLKVIFVGLIQCVNPGRMFLGGSALFSCPILFYLFFPWRVCYSHFYPPGLTCGSFRSLQPIGFCSVGFLPNLSTSLVNVFIGVPLHAALPLFPHPPFCRLIIRNYFNCHSWLLSGYILPPCPFSNFMVRAPIHLQKSTYCLGLPSCSPFLFHHL